MVVGVRQADLKVLETADLLSFPTTSISEVYREWSKKREKYPASASSLGENIFLMSGIGGEWEDSNWDNHITTKVCRRASLNPYHIEPWATAA